MTKYVNIPETNRKKVGFYVDQLKSAPKGKAVVFTTASDVKTLRSSIYKACKRAGLTVSTQITSETELLAWLVSA